MWFCHVMCLILLNIPAGVTIHPLSLSLPPFLPSLCLCPSLSTYLSLSLPTTLSLSLSLPLSLSLYLSLPICPTLSSTLFSFSSIYPSTLSTSPSLSLAPSTSYYGKPLLFPTFPVFSLFSCISISFCLFRAACTECILLVCICTCCEFAPLPLFTFAVFAFMCRVVMTSS